MKNAPVIATGRGQPERLARIEQLLWWRGWVRRSDLASQCRISLVQATIDLRVFQQRRPGVMRYDRKAARYVATSRLSIENGNGQLEEASALLERMPRSPGTGPWCGRVTLPARRAERSVTRALVRAILGGQALRIRYASLNSDTFRWRWISPHALGSDGFRWHVRAFCHDEKDFRDFVVGRIAATGENALAAAKAADDVAWSDPASAALVPAPDLGRQQRRALELDFLMSSGRLTLHASKAMMIYTLAALGLSDEAGPVSTRFRAC